MLSEWQTGFHHSSELPSTARKRLPHRRIHSWTGSKSACSQLRGRLFTYICYSLLFSSACASSIMAGNTPYMEGYGGDAAGTYTYNLTITPEEMNAPVSLVAIIFPILSWTAWLLCVAPMIWHFRQANIAAGSLILWIILHNFFNSINPLIWPRDNLLEWWSGEIWCDIQVRVQVGSYVGMTASLTLVLRKLAHVMDTSNMTVSASQKSKVKAKIWEVFWCWGVPFMFMAIFYIVQNVRYVIVGIAGCWSMYDEAWPSMLLSFMWPTVGMLFATYWGSLLIYRLYRYRREFHRMVAARNTTSSRFVRLFLLSLVIILFYLPYTVFLLVASSARVRGPYSWNRVHDPSKWNKIVREPSHGQLSFEKWIQIATGYIMFALLGTGVDANAHYRRLLVRMGAGKIFPSLYVASHNGSRTPNSFIVARTWTANISSRAKSMLWCSKTDSTNDTWNASTCNNSVALNSIPRLHSVTTQDTLISQKTPNSTTTTTQPSPRPSFFTRYFFHPSLHGPLLPLFSYRNITEINTNSPTTAGDTNKPSTSSSSTKAPIGVHARAWATDISSSPSAAATMNNGGGPVNGVHVVREVHQHRDEKSVSEYERVDKEMRGWA